MTMATTAGPEGRDARAPARPAFVRAHHGPPLARIAHRARAAALAALAALLPIAPAFAQARHYEFDPVHTRVMFAISHAGYSQAIGTVSGSTGTLEFDPDDWSSARVQVRVPVARLDLGDEKWTGAALASNLLDARDHPEATFTSTRVEPVDARHAAVFGTLTLHGVAREVKLDVVFNQLKRYPLPPFRRTVGFSATAAISRKDFGIDAWPSVIGDRVELRIEAEAHRARGGGEPADAGAEDRQAPPPDQAQPMPPKQDRNEAIPPLDEDESTPTSDEGDATPTDARPVEAPPAQGPPPEAPMKADPAKPPGETPPPAGEGEPASTPPATATAPDAAAGFPRSAAALDGILAAPGTTAASADVDAGAPAHALLPGIPPTIAKARA